MSMRTGVFCLTILALLLLVLSGAAIAQKDVNVVNTPNVSVTNTPSVTVSNTPTVTVGNTPSVNVTNTPNVNITNSNTQPVFNTSIDNPGRIAYQSQVTNSSGSCSGAGACFFEFGNVPAGHRLVIQHVSGVISTTGVVGAVWVQVNNGSGAPISSFFTATAPSTIFSAFDQTVQTYFDPAAFGGVIEVEVSLIGGTFPPAGQAEVITLSGYELDCNAAPCAPIAH